MYCRGLNHKGEAMAIARLMANICSQDLAASRDFYQSLLDLKVTFESDWFVQLTSGRTSLELGIIQQDHELIPPEFHAAPQGCYLTFVVDDVDAVYARAQALGLAIRQPPKDEFYGQRRLLLTDPNGLLIDISSPAGPRP
jgi:catechol 2,3-dioxygenase-like lactoylglutathione lyase family enzyme